jgi:methanogenic corrinoid protein MtbC1
MKQLIELIKNNEKTKAVKLALSMLDEQKITIVDLYQTFLMPALNEIECAEEDTKCIWQEHIRTNIVRTIIESAYVYIVQYLKDHKVKPLNKKVLVVCPTDEYHEIGARMATDFFMMNGYDVTYIGANSPLEVIVSAVEVEQPNILAVSVTNIYHLSATKHMIDVIKESSPTVKIYGGGQAFSSPLTKEAVSPDEVLWTFDDFVQVAKGEK